MSLSCVRRRVRKNFISSNSSFFSLFRSFFSFSSCFDVAKFECVLHGAGAGGGEEEGGRGGRECFFFLELFSLIFSRVL